MTNIHRGRNGPTEFNPAPHRHGGPFELAFRLCKRVTHRGRHGSTDIKTSRTRLLSAWRGKRGSSSRGRFRPCRRKAILSQIPQISAKIKIGEHLARGHILPRAISPLPSTYSGVQLGLFSSIELEASQLSLGRKKIAQSLAPFMFPERRRPKNRPGRLP